MASSTDRPDVPAPALDAMRRWLINRVPNDERSAWASLDDALARSYVEVLYPGGVSAFLRDHGNEGGEGR